MGFGAASSNDRSRKPKDDLTKTEKQQGQRQSSEYLLSTRPSSAENEFRERDEKQREGNMHNGSPPSRKLHRPQLENPSTERVQKPRLVQQWARLEKCYALPTGINYRVRPYVWTPYNPAATETKFRPIAFKPINLNQKVRQYRPWTYALTCSNYGYAFPGPDSRHVTIHDFIPASSVPMKKSRLPPPPPPPAVKTTKPKKAVSQNGRFDSNGFYIAREYVYREYQPRNDVTPKHKYYKGLGPYRGHTYDYVLVYLGPQARGHSIVKQKQAGSAPKKLISTSPPLAPPPQAEVEEEEEEEKAEFVEEEEIVEEEVTPVPLVVADTPGVQKSELPSTHQTPGPHGEDVPVGVAAGTAVVGLAAAAAAAPNPPGKVSADAPPVSGAVVAPPVVAKAPVAAAAAAAPTAKAEPVVIATAIASAAGAASLPSAAKQHLAVPSEAPGALGSILRTLQVIG